LIRNPNLLAESTKPVPDYLYHFGLDTSMPLQEMFGDVKFVVAGGSASRAKILASMLYADPVISGRPRPIPGLEPTPIGKTDRFSLYKIGPVISVNHGMGMPSASICWHEIAKLLHYAGAQGVTFIRAGTSGGLGVPPGTVVFTTAGVNGQLKEHYSLPILGEKRRFSTQFSPRLTQDLYQTALSLGLPAALGKTLSTDCFYEGQGRIDGALCEYTEADKFAFLHKLEAMGVKNIEMEAAQFAAFTQRLGVDAALVCVTIVNRLLGDQVAVSPAEIESFVNNGLIAILALIRQRLTAAQ
jgi:uridine phosphorylase